MTVDGSDDQTNGDEDARRALLLEAELRAAATEAIVRAKGSSVLLLPHVTSRARLREGDGGRSVIEVIDADGLVRIRDDKGTPMTLDDVVTELRQEEWARRAFDDAPAPAATWQASDYRKAAALAKPAARMSAAEKTAFIAEHGIDAWAMKVNEDYTRAH